MSDQLILKFPSRSAYKKEDFYVSPSNQEAYDFINSWPKWIKKTINIFGPPGSGKTHLASILKSKTKCLQIDSNKLSEEIFYDFIVQDSGVYRIIRNSDLTYEEEAEDLILHFSKLLNKRRKGQIVRLDTLSSNSKDVDNFVVDKEKK